MLGGQHDASEDRVDVADLCRRVGLDYCQTRAVGLEPDERHLLLDNGLRLAFDVLSLNLGSVAKFLDGQASVPHGRPVHQQAHRPASPSSAGT